MVTALWTVIIFLLMVSLHEFGHFIVAKLSGIEVKEYAIGMGPAIFKKQGKETLYSVRILPIGGYCAFEGEDEDSDSERAFCNSHILKRIAVVVAGAVMNVLLGFVIFVVMCANNTPLVTNEIESLDQRTNMYEAGVMPGDRIVEINGKNMHYFRDIDFYVGELPRDKDVEITVKRNGEKLKFSFPLSREEIEHTYEENGYLSKTTINGKTEEEFLPYPEGIDKTEYVGKTASDERYILGFFAKTEEGAWSVIKDAYYETIFASKLIYNSVLDMVKGNVGIDQLSGPIGVVDTVNTVVKQDMGILPLLSMAALLTINLGIFNLLPIPALDGGRLIFLLYELIFRKKIPPEKEGLVHTIGFILLMILAVIIAGKDIYMIITR
ncbi:MAG: site-2 protease family protein [Clostridia bacterium]|nr:site-2 protease family protein [Clostridia bacterium]